MTGTSSGLAQQPRRKYWFRRFSRDEGGGSAVEFALVAVPFFALIFAIIEISLIFFGSMMMEQQLATSARMVLTGEQQNKDETFDTNNAAMPAAQRLEKKKAAFAKSVCNPTKGSGEVVSTLSYLFDCSKLKIDVRQISAFSRTDMAKPIVNQQVDPNFGKEYNLGKENEIVVVRILYEWPTLVINWPYRAMNIVMNFSDIKDNKRVIMASYVFKNEPYKQ